MELVTYYTSYLLVTYFSVFKLWFTLRAPASAEAPESSIAFNSRLWRSRISTNSACYNRALCRSGFLLIAHLIVIIPNSLKITVVFSLQLLRNMLSNSVCIVSGVAVRHSHSKNKTLIQ